MSALVESGRELVEHLHNVDDVIVHSRQCLYDGLRLSPTKVAKRYLGNELAIALELLCEIEGRNARYAALVRDVTTLQFGGILEGPRMNNDNQCLVLVDNIHLMYGKEQRVERVGEVVRLQPLNEVENVAVFDSLYFSFVLAKHVRRGWPFFENREANGLDVLSPVLNIREMPHNVIEARSKVVNDLPRDSAFSLGDYALRVILNCLSENLVILISENWVFAILKKPCDLGLKIKDVLVGPI